MIDVSVEYYDPESGRMVQQTELIEPLPAGVRAWLDTQTSGIWCYWTPALASRRACIIVKTPLPAAPNLE